MGTAPKIVVIEQESVKRIADQLIQTALLIVLISSFHSSVAEKKHTESTRCSTRQNKTPFYRIPALFETIG